MKKLFSLFIAALMSASMWALNQDTDGYYLLGSAQDWQDFATLVQTTPTANAKMTADIDLGTQITMIAEDVDQPYQGTFDGQGHTLTVNWTADGEDRVAPFRYADGATIKRLHVDGSITKTGTYGRCPAGILACSLGSATTTITECWSSVSLYAFDTMGGLLSVACGNSTTNIVDCMFSGSISASNSSGCSGGFASHADKEYLHSEQGEPTVNITRGLNLGTFPGSNAYLSYTFIRMGNIVFGTHTVTSCYYKNVYGNAQGTQVSDAQLADGTTTTALNAGRTGDEAVWVQDPVTNQPMLKIFVSEGNDPVEPDAWENGALSGKFSINSNGDQIVFSQGNLQYFCSTTAPEWRFAEHQYDYVPFDMSAYAANSEKWIDLFAHGTSGYDNGQTNYQPYIVGANPNTYYQGNLTGNAEWGYNAISNGGNTENFGWRTPTRDEWIYLFSGRTDAASKYGHGSIDWVHGMILLPDEWTTPEGLGFTPGNSVWANAYTLEQWSLMEDAGAVFLPASGSCNNVGIPSESLQNQNGFYRASTAAYYVYFSQGSIQNCTMSFYQYGDAVRLVQAVPKDTPTAIDQTPFLSGEGRGEASRLILQNCQIFILRGDKIYTLTGQVVK